MDEELIPGNLYSFTDSFNYSAAIYVLIGFLFMDTLMILSYFSFLLERGWRNGEGRTDL
jgi:hypothetical protein